MKTKIFTCLSVGIFSLILAGIYISMFFNKEESEPRQASLIIKGKTIDSENVEVYPDYAMMPMLKVFESFGVTVRWIDSDNVEISYGDILLTLSLSEKSLIEHKYGNELLTPVPGSSTFQCVVVEDDVILDSETIYTILIYQFGIRTEVTVDYQQGEVSIEERLD